MIVAETLYVLTLVIAYHVLLNPQHLLLTDNGGESATAETGVPSSEAFHAE